MFNGIIETTACIEHIHLQDACKYFCISAKHSLPNLALGDSLAVNGVCLTITALKAEKIEITAIPETLKRSNLNLLAIGDQVNLERPLAVSSRLSGHYVQGHIDCMAQIISIEKQGAALVVNISMPKEYARYIVNKGYIALDGMSITVIEANASYFSVAFIPYTQNACIIPYYRAGTMINIEVDILAKHLEKLFIHHQHEEGLSHEHLSRTG
jgi:riboflavin synthase